MKVARVAQQVAAGLLGGGGGGGAPVAGGDADYSLPVATAPAVELPVQSYVTCLSQTGPHPALLYTPPNARLVPVVAVILPFPTPAAPDTRCLLDGLVACGWRPTCVTYDLFDGGASLSKVEATCRGAGAVLCGVPPTDVDLLLHALLLGLRHEGVAVFQCPRAGLWTPGQAFPHAETLLSLCPKLLLPRPSTCAPVRKHLVPGGRARVAMWTCSGLEHIRLAVCSAPMQKLRSRCASLQGLSLDVLDIAARLPDALPVSVLRCADATRDPLHVAAGATHHVLLLSPLGACDASPPGSEDVDQQLAEWMLTLKHNSDVVTAQPFLWLRRAPSGLTPTELYCAHLLRLGDRLEPPNRNVRGSTQGGKGSGGVERENAVHDGPFLEAGTLPGDPPAERLHPASRPARATGTGPHVLALLLPDPPAAVASCGTAAYGAIEQRFWALVSQLLAHPDVSVVPVDTTGASDEAVADAVGACVVEDTWQRVQADVEPAGPTPIAPPPAAPPRTWHPPGGADYVVRGIDTDLLRALTHGSPRLVVVRHPPAGGATTLVARAISLAQRGTMVGSHTSVHAAHVSARLPNGEARPAGEVLAELCALVANAHAALLGPSPEAAVPSDLAAPLATVSAAQQALLGLCAAVSSPQARVVLCIDDADALAAPATGPIDWLAPLLAPAPPTGAGLSPWVQVVLLLRDEGTAEATLQLGDSHLSASAQQQQLRLLASMGLPHGPSAAAVADAAVPLPPVAGPGEDAQALALLHWLACPSLEQEAAAKAHADPKAAFDRGLLTLDGLSEHQRTQCLASAAAGAFTPLPDAATYALGRLRSGSSSPWFCITAVWLLLRTPGYRPHEAPRLITKLPTTCGALALAVVTRAQEQLGYRLGILPASSASGALAAEALCATCLRACLAPIVAAGEPLVMPDAAWCAARVALHTPGVDMYAHGLALPSVFAAVCEDVSPLLQDMHSAGGCTPGCSPAARVLRLYCASLLSRAAEALAARFGPPAVDMSHGQATRMVEPHAARHGVRYCIRARRWGDAAAALVSADLVAGRDVACVVREVDTLLHCFDHAASAVDTSSGHPAAAVGLTALDKHVRLQRVLEVAHSRAGCREWWPTQGEWPAASCAVAGADPCTAGTFFDTRTAGEAMYGIPCVPPHAQQQQRVSAPGALRPFGSRRGILMPPPSPPPSSPRGGQLVVPGRGSSTAVALPQLVAALTREGIGGARQVPGLMASSPPGTVVDPLAPPSHHFAAWLGHHVAPRDAVALLGQLRAMRWFLRAHAHELHRRPGLLAQVLASAPTGTLGRQLSGGAALPLDGQPQPGTPLQLTWMCPPDSLVVPSQRIVVGTGTQHAVRVTCVATGRQPDVVACGCDDGSLRVYSTSGDPVICCRASSTAAVSAACWCEAGTLVVGCSSGEACVINLPVVSAGGTVVRHVTVSPMEGTGTQAVTAVCVAAGTVLTTSLDGAMRFFAASSPHGTLLAPFDAKCGPLACGALHARGDAAVTGAFDGSCTCWRLFPGIPHVGGATAAAMRHVPSVTCLLRGLTSCVTCVVFTPCATRAVAASDDGALAAWDAASGRVLVWADPPPARAGVRPSVTALSCGQHTDVVASASRDGSLRFWHLPPPCHGVKAPAAAPPREVHPYAVLPGAPGTYLGAAFTADMRRLVTVCDVPDAGGACIHLLEHAGHSRGPSAGAPGLHIVEAPVQQTPGEQHVAGRMPPRRTVPTEWDPPWASDTSVFHSNGAVSALGVLSSGGAPQVLVSAGEGDGGTVHLWTLDAGAPGALAPAGVARLPRSAAGRTRCLASRGGALLTGGDDGLLCHHVLSPSGQMTGHDLSGMHAGAVRCVSMLSEQRGASGADDGCIRVYSLGGDDPHAVAALQARSDGPLPPVRALAWPTDDSLLSGGDDRSLRLWHAELGVVVAQWRAEAAITALDTLPAPQGPGVLAAVGTAAGEVLLYDTRCGPAIPAVRLLPRPASPCGGITSLRRCATRPAWLAASCGGHGVWVGDLRMADSRRPNAGGVSTEVAVGAAPCVGLARVTALAWVDSTLVVGDAAGRLRCLSVGV